MTDNRKSPFDCRTVPLTVKVSPNLKTRLSAEATSQDLPTSTVVFNILDDILPPLPQQPVKEIEL